MANDNPFAAPQDDFAPVYDVADSQGQVWRSGKLLVFTRNAPLPQRCIKCNTTHEVTMRERKLYYYPPWILLFIFCNLIVLLIVAIVFRKNATTQLGVCGDCWRRRRNGILLSWLLLLVGVGSFFALGILADTTGPDGFDRFGVPMLIGAVGCLLASAIVGLVRGQLLVVRKIDDVQVRLSRINQAYLALLPAGP